MAKTRAQRKAERRRREAQAQRQGTPEGGSEARAQQRTQVPESADVVEAELAEAGADLEALKEAPPGDGSGQETELVPAPETLPEAPAPSRADVGRPAGRAEAEAPPADKISRRARRREEREARQRAKESEARRKPREEAPERQRGAVMGFLYSCWAELRRVQWPDRRHVGQGTAVVLGFVVLAGGYLGLLDAIVSRIIQAIL